MWRWTCTLSGFSVGALFLVAAPTYRLSSDFWIGAIVSTFTIFYTSHLLRQRLRSHLPLCTIFFVLLVGTYAKFAAISYYVFSNREEELQLFLSSSSHLPASALDPDNLSLALLVSSLGMVGLAIATFLTTPPFRAQAVKPPIQPVPPLHRRSQTLFNVFLASGFLLLLITNYLAHRYDFGFMGREQARLPFRLTGIVSYLRTLPEILFIAVLFWAIAARWPRYVILGFLALGSLVIAISLFAGGRGSFTMIIIYLGFFYAIYGGLRIRVVSVIFTLFIASSLLRPLFENYRQIASRDNAGFDALDTVQAARASLQGNYADIGDQLIARASNIVFRIIGYDSLLIFTSNSPPPFSSRRVIDVFSGTLHVGRVLTDEYIGSNSGDVHTAAPSLMGTCYYLAGMNGVVVGVCIFGLLMQSFYFYVLRITFWLQATVLVKIATVTFANSSEGNFVTFIKDNLVWIIFILALEKICRWTWNRGTIRSLRSNVGMAVLPGSSQQQQQ